MGDCACFLLIYEMFLLNFKMYTNSMNGFVVLMENFIKEYKSFAGYYAHLILENMKIILNSNYSYEIIKTLCCNRGLFDL